MAPPKDQQAKIEASLVLWLLLTTNPTFAVYDLGAGTLTPGEWNPDNPPASLKGLSTNVSATIKEILNYLATNKFPGDTITYAEHLEAIQQAFQAVMKSQTVGFSMADPPPYVPGQNCPRIDTLSDLILAYPDAAAEE